ncbi:hypothetical protein V1522DRAFT_447642 [Lipomyces starkeyi]
MDLSFTEKEAYQSALNFLIANEPEQRLDVRLPFDCYLALEEEARKRYGDEGHPCSKSSTSSLHAKALQFLQRWIEEGGRRELAKRGMGKLGERLGPVVDETLTVVAIEVGVSEKYEKLVTDATIWMEEFHYRTGILFSLKETPRFRYPARGFMNAFSLTNDLEPFQDAIIELGPNQPFGPYPYRGNLV